MQEKNPSILFPASFIAPLTLSQRLPDSNFCKGCKSLFAAKAVNRCTKGEDRHLKKNHTEGTDTGKFLNLRYSYCATKCTANNPQMYSTRVYKAVTVRGVKRVLSMFIE